MAREEPLESSFACLSPSKQVSPTIIPAVLPHSPSLSSSPSQVLVQVQTNHNISVQPVVPEVLEKHFPQLGCDIVRGNSKARSVS